MDPNDSQKRADEELPPGSYLDPQLPDTWTDEDLAELQAPQADNGEASE